MHYVIWLIGILSLVDTSHRGLSSREHAVWVAMAVAAFFTWGFAISNRARASGYQSKMNEKALLLANNLRCGRIPDQPFGLFLRPFYTRGSLLIKNPYKSVNMLLPSYALMPGSQDVDEVFRIGTKSLIVKIGAIGDEVGAGIVGTNKQGDNEWKDVFFALATHAKFIIMIPIATDSTCWEIVQLLSPAYLKKTIFLMPKQSFTHIKNKKDREWLFLNHHKIWEASKSKLNRILSESNHLQPHGGLRSIPDIDIGSMFVVCDSNEPMTQRFLSAPINTETMKKLQELLRNGGSLNALGFAELHKIGFNDVINRAAIPAAQSSSSEESIFHHLSEIRDRMVDEYLHSGIRKVREFEVQKLLDEIWRRDM
jgi:hypothetical protein